MRQRNTTSIRFRNLRALLHLFFDFLPPLFFSLVIFSVIVSRSSSTLANCLTVGCFHLIFLRNLFTFFMSNASGSMGPPSHSIIDRYSLCRGLLMISSSSTYPPMPPQSSGGQARLPSMHSAKPANVLLSGRIRLTVIRCSHESPKSYS